MGLPVNVELTESDLVFNRRNCSEFNLIVSSFPKIPRLNEDIEEIELDGRNGSLTIKKGTYRNRNITISFKMLDTYFFWDTLSKIEEWLYNVKDNRLFYDRQDRCFRVKRVIVGDLAKEVDLYGEFEVTFVCEPFMTDISPISITLGNMTYEMDNTKILYNDGDFEVEPRILIEGNGNIEIIINDAIIQLRDVIDSVEIDTKLMQVRDSSGANFSMNMYGDFPTLKKGANKISYIGNVKNMRIEYTNLYR